MFQILRYDNIPAVANYVTIPAVHNYFTIPAVHNYFTSCPISNAIPYGLYSNVTHLLANLLIIIIIIINRKGRQCKAGRERLTPYQSEDPNPTTPTHRMKEEKGKTVGDKK